MNDSQKLELVLNKLQRYVNGVKRGNGPHIARYAVRETLESIINEGR
tara:strand:+ start:1632 stop:1772 length:141 start_codon:yes stop_codon:yes gene_type:complete